MPKQSETFDVGLQPEFLALVEKFDRLSIKGKRKMIHRFDVVVFEAKSKEGESILAEVRDIAAEMKVFFQKRLEAQSE